MSHSTLDTNSFSPLPQVVMSSDAFYKIKDLIYRRAGIVLDNHKKDMVYNRLMRRIRTLKLSNFSEYLQFLEREPEGNEWQEFVNALTTNLTAFFREPHHFEILERHARERKGSYNVWSSAASTGEEPCSIAMTLHRALGPSYETRVWATDIDTQVLEHAKRGIYRLDDIASLSDEIKKKYFLRGQGEKAGFVRVRKEILSSIRYQSLNLLADRWNVPEKFDAIFCRNVMIYFDKKSQLKILQRFAPMLKPGGLLFIGHSENFYQLTKEFYLIGKTVYGLTRDQQ